MPKLATNRPPAPHVLCVDCIQPIQMSRGDDLHLTASMAGHCSDCGRWKHNACGKNGRCKRCSGAEYAAV